MGSLGLMDVKPRAFPAELCNLICNVSAQLARSQGRLLAAQPCLPTAPHAWLAHCRGCVPHAREQERDTTLLLHLPTCRCPLTRPGSLLPDLPSLSAPSLLSWWYGSWSKTRRRPGAAVWSRQRLRRRAGSGAWCSAPRRAPCARCPALGRLYCSATRPWRGGLCSTATRPGFSSQVGMGVGVRG